MVAVPAFRAVIAAVIGGAIQVTIANDAITYTPPLGSAERQAICDAARAHVTAKAANAPLPQPIVFKIEHLLIEGRFCNLEAVPVFKDGTNPIPKYLPDVVFNLCLERDSNGWKVVTDLTRSDVPGPAEVAQIQSRLPPGFPMTVLSPTWRDLLTKNK